MKTHIFIQARMSSSRYPGKVLAPIFGVPLIKNLVDRASKVKNKSKVVVLTSNEPSDDPLVSFLVSIRCPVYRGSLNNVFERFRTALNHHPCDYFVRLCGDSPFIDPLLIETLIKNGVEQGYDLISNVFARKFPKGQAVEIIKSNLFKEIPDSALDDKEREHVMPYFYKNKDRYNSIFFELNKDLSHINQCIDTLEDMKDLEAKKSLFVFDEKELCVAKH